MSSVKTQPAIKPKAPAARPTWIARERASFRTFSGNSRGARSTTGSLCAGEEDILDDPILVESAPADRLGALAVAAADTICFLLHDGIVHVPRHTNVNGRVAGVAGDGTRFHRACRQQNADDEYPTPLHVPTFL